MANATLQPNQVQGLWGLLRRFRTCPSVETGGMAHPMFPIAPKGLHLVAVEELKFDLDLKNGAFEVRDYGASVVAEVTVTGDQQQAGRNGFRLLAEPPWTPSFLRRNEVMLDVAGEMSERQ